MGQQTPGALIQGGVYSRACIFLKAYNTNLAVFSLQLRVPLRAGDFPWLLSA